MLEGFGKGNNTAGASLGAENLLDTANEFNGNESGAKQKTTITSESSMFSMFGSNTYGLTAKLIDRVNTILKDKNATGAAKHVPLGSSNFNGVLITLKLDGKEFHQPLIIDERPVKNIKALLEDDRAAGGGTILFATALTFEKNRSYLEAFKAPMKKGVSLDPLVIVSESVDNDDAELNKVIIQTLMRMEAKLFSNVKDIITADKNKDLVASFSNEGQNVAILLNPKNTNTSMSDMIMGASGPVLGVQARVDLTIGGKDVFENNAPVRTLALRPIVYINAYEKPKTIAAFNMEYSLLAIAASTVLLDKDKIYASLIPNSKGRNNIGNLNPLVPSIKDPSGNHKQINLQDPKVDLMMILKYIDDVTTDHSMASIGIDVDYRINPTGLNGFAAIVDANASTTAKTEALNALSTAFENVTGTTYAGHVTESVSVYPTGYMIDNKGNKISLREVDAIWLASLPLDNGMSIKLAEEWLISSADSKTGLQIKLDVLKKVQELTGIEIKPIGLGMKIILTNEFVNAIVAGASFVVSSSAVLDLPNKASSLQQYVGGLRTSGTGINGIGVQYGNTNQNKYNIVG